MPYMIETFDRPGSLDVRRANRAEHLVYLDRIKARLLACGAKLNDDGSDAGGGGACCRSSPLPANNEQKDSNKKKKKGGTPL